MKLQVWNGQFANHYMYGIWRAISEMLPRETGEAILERTSEIVFDEIQKEQGINETEPMALLQRLARYFEEIGYAEETIEPIGPYELKRSMTNLTLTDCPAKLGKEGYIIPGPSHHIMWAALKKQCGLKVVPKPIPGGASPYQEGVPPHKWVFRSHWLLEKI
ncbi:MAG: hypothetical protein HY529_03845 [Chloroflexi bacterium]|nr:hypothetical protein [Chloroflexota bacterium]